MTIDQEYGQLKRAACEAGRALARIGNRASLKEIYAVKAKYRNACMDRDLFVKANALYLSALGVL